jgi:Tol biopolymer transport system component
MLRFAFAAKYALLLVCLLLTCCTEDIPDPVTEEDLMDIIGTKLSQAGDTSVPLTDDSSSNLPVDKTDTQPSTIDDTSEPSKLPEDKTPVIVPEAVNTKIAFVSDRSGTEEIYIMDANGANQRRLTEGEMPSWSPDGSRLAFTVYLDETAEIRLINADGTGQRPLIARGWDNPGWDENPSWSPDGRRVAFSSIPMADFIDFFDFSPEIHVTNADGTGMKRLTNNQDWNSDPCWSPDGMMVAFASEDVEGNSEIYMVNADGANLRRLTNNPAWDSQPDWSPDGRKIAFVSDRGDNEEIYVMNVNGANQINLTRHPALDGMPSWSPDGTRIAFASDRDGNGEIYVMNADGTNQRRLTNNPADDWSPSWSPILRAAPAFRW